MSDIRVVLVDDHRILLDGISAILREQTDITLVATYTSPTLFLSELHEIHVDVVVVDINMKELNGFDLAKVLRKDYPNISIVCLTMHTDIDHINEMLNIGVLSYLPKDVNNSELVYAVRKAAIKERYIPEEILGLLNKYIGIPHKQDISNLVNVSLSKREIEILQLISMEYTNAKIANVLYISERTVETHRKNILRKSKFSTMNGLIRHATNMGWLE